MPDDVQPAGQQPPSDPMIHQPAASDVPGGVREAIREARARLAKGESLYAAASGDEQPAEPEEQPKPQDPPAPPPEREDEGQEGDQLEEEEGDGVAGDDADEETGEGEAAEEEGDEDEDAAPTETFVAKLPGRRAGDPDIEIPLEGLSQEEREAFNRLRNGYMRRERAEAVMAEVAEERAELDGIYTALRTDPIGFIVGQVDKSLHAKLVKFLLTDDEVYDAVVDDVAKWDEDPKEKRAAVAELREERRREQEIAREQAARIQAARRSVQEITAALERMIPSGMDPDRAAQFMGYALRDLEEHTKRHRINDLTPERAIEVLKSTGTLRLFGIKPKAPSARRRAPASPAAGTRSEGLPPARPKGPTEERIRRKAQKASEGFRQASTRRRAAAAVAPAGAGAEPVKLTPPKGQGIKERLKWWRENRAR